FTLGVTNTPRTVEHAVSNLWGTVDGLGARAKWYGDPNAAVMRQPPDLLLVDEADRLKTAILEQIRDFYDRARRRGAHRHAGFAETTGPLRSAVLAGRIRPPVPTLERAGAARGDRAPMGATRPGPGFVRSC